MAARKRRFSGDGSKATTRPALYFLYRYFFLLGILDGKTGFVFHFLQAFWFRLVVDVRLEELLRNAKDLET